MLVIIKSFPLFFFLSNTDPYFCKFEWFNMVEGIMYLQNSKLLLHMQAAYECFIVGFGFRYWYTVWVGSTWRICETAWWFLIQLVRALPLFPSLDLWHCGLFSDHFFLLLYFGIILGSKASRDFVLHWVVTLLSCFMLH